MAKLIMGLVGPIASGKDTVKKYLVEKYKAEDCRFSTVLRDLLVRIGVPESRGNMQQMSTAIRKTFGEDVLARVIAADAKGFKSDIVVVNGVRRLDDIKYLENLSGFVLVSIDAPPEIRYERLVKRGENVDDVEKTYEQFLKDHEYETETSIPAVMEKATHKLDNKGSLADLYGQIDEIIKKTLR